MLRTQLSLALVLSWCFLVGFGSGALASGPTYWGTPARGMSGAYTAAAGGINGISYNPASSSSITDYEVTTDFTRFSQNNLDVTRGSMGAGMGTGLFTQALAFNRTALNFGFDNFSLTTPGLNLNYNDNILYYNASLQPFSSVRLGANAKYFSVRSDVENANAIGYGADLGYQQFITKRVIFGISVLNLTANREWDSGLTEEIPMHIRAGVRVRPIRGLAVEIDAVNDEITGFNSVSGGVEWWLTRKVEETGRRVGLTFRGGVEFVQVGNKPRKFSAGVSFKTTVGEIHYAFVKNSNFNNQQQFGLTLNFGKNR
ncbi:MAG: hypothetical protein ABEK50_03800 [bacterium]